MKKEFIIAVFCFGLLLLFGAFSLEAKAATFIVTRTDDRAATCNSGVDCSLREAVQKANGGDVIEFSSLFNTPQTITLTSGQPLPMVNTFGTSQTRVGTITINGRGANMLTINGDNRTVIFLVDQYLSLNLTGMTLTNGNAGTGYGGAISLNGNISQLNQVVIKNCQAGKGGAISMNNGVVYINNSTIYNNSASERGSAIFYSFGGNSDITNSTISGNTSPDEHAAAIYAFATTLNIANSTITKNSANGGNSAGAIYNDPGNYASINIKSSIVAENPNSGSPNISSPNSRLSVSNSLTGGNPRLLPLADNAVNPNIHLPTHAIDACSPAINAGDPNGQSTDERGAPRAINGQADIGAYESNLSPCPTAITVTSNKDTGSGTLRQAISDLADGGTITFASGVSNIHLPSGSIPIYRNITINGAGAVTIFSGGFASIFYISNGAIPNVNGINFVGGTVTSGNGGAIQNYGTLNLTNSTISGISATNSGGGIYNDGTLNASNIVIQSCSAAIGGGITNNGTMNVTNSTVSGNTGDGVFNGGGTLTLLSSTVSGNNNGGIINSATLSLLNSTVSGNQASGKGAGIYNNGGSVLATVLNSTITDNHGFGYAGAGVWNDNFSGSNTFRVRNSIIDGNFSDSGSPDYVGDRTDLGNNLIGSGNSRLAPLGNYGGATQTHALLQTSAALDAGNNCVLTANGCGATTRL